MGLLATEFDEEEFKREYGKVCYEDGFRDGMEIAIREQKEAIIKAEKETGVKLISDSDREKIAVALYKSKLSIGFATEITGLSNKEIRDIIMRTKK